MQNRMTSGLTFFSENLWSRAPSMRYVLVSATDIASTVSKYSGLIAAGGLVTLEFPVLNYACYLAMYPIMGSSTASVIDGLAANLSTAVLLSAKTYIASNIINFSINKLSKDIAIKEAAKAEATVAGNTPPKANKMS